MSSRAASEGPSISGHGGAAASKKVKRSRSNTPVGGLPAQHYVWDDHSGRQQRRTELVKTEWQSASTGHAQDHHAPDRSASHDAAGASSQLPHLTHDVNEQPNRALEQQMPTAKQEENQVVNMTSTKRTGLKVKLKFKSR